MAIPHLLKYGDFEFQWNFGYKYDFMVPLNFLSWCQRAAVPVYHRFSKDIL